MAQNLMEITEIRQCDILYLFKLLLPPRFLLFAFKVTEKRRRLPDITNLHFYSDLGNFVV